METYIALGSNIGNLKKNLTKAINLINKLPNTSVQKVSSFYKTKPVGYLNQPDFLNAVICTKTTLSPILLLEHLQKIEITLKKNKQFENGPRTIDLDILMYGFETINLKNLIIPHPRMFERLFVLIPLNEIISDELEKHFSIQKELKKQITTIDHN